MKTKKVATVWYKEDDKEILKAAIKILKKNYGKKCRSFVLDCVACRGNMVIDMLQDILLFQDED